MKLLNKERIVFVALLILVAGYGVFMTFKVLENNTIMLVPMDKVANVETCIENNVACSLLYSSEEEIPAK